MRANGQVCLRLFPDWYISDAPLKVSLGFCVWERKLTEGSAILNTLCVTYVPATGFIVNDVDPDLLARGCLLVSPLKC